MRRIDWNMHAHSGFEREPVGMMLQMRLVTRRVPVDCPELLDFSLGQHLAVILMEDADVLTPLDLQQEIAFTVDVIGRHAVRGGHENDDFLASHLALEVAAAHVQKVGHAIVQERGIGRILFRSLEGDPGARRFNPADRFIDGKGRRGGSPTLVDVRDASVVIEIFGPDARRVAGKLNNSRQRKQGIPAQPMAEEEVALVEIQLEFFAIDEQHGLAALHWRLRGHIENARHMPWISVRCIQSLEARLK